ncbi:MAG: proton-conducting transporter membrane subunit [Poseidonia sp.]|jgi:NADH:ubiquinone oxidoreductase subunit 5 (subunit L)/multisubunit Na+/H+ antiporter MnhA subunit
MAASTGSSVIVESTAAQYAPLIILLPMLAFPVILLFGKLYNGEKFWKQTLKEGGLIALPVMGASLLLALWLISDFIGAYGGVQKLSDWTWFTSSIWESGVATKEVSFGFGIHVDHITVLLLFVASFLCLLINTFAIGYMNTDPINDNRNHRFYAEFVLFCSGMLGMVLADSFLWLFIFWELMGLCSYLLIGFYYERPSAAYAAKKAFLTTRVGDVFLMVGLAMMWYLFGSLDYDVVFDKYEIKSVAESNASMLAWSLGLMFIGAVGKSAQFPLHVWLPDAMEGPTPVSALIHAATMVNAGLYLVARMFPFFGAEALHGELADLAFIIAAIGGTTAVMAAAIAFVQNDLKKVLAYSTMSQLAYIFTGLGAALYLANTLHWHEYLADGTKNPDYYVNHAIVIVAFGAALFHLFNHAMAKGMLFMASGAVIHEVHHAHHHLHHHDHDDGHHDTPKELVMLADYLEANGQTAFDFFASIDLDGSGEIDTYEFQTALKNADVVDLPPWEMAPLMKALDLDGNGSINVPELDLTLGRIRNEIDEGHHDEFDAQSMENMGGLASKMPLTATAMLVGSLSIMGFPLIGGFWSKEGIIANTWRVALDDPRFMYPALCVLLGAGMTGFYMSRMWLKTFAGSPKGEVAAHVGPTNTWIKTPLFILTFFSLAGILFASMGFTHWAPDIEYGLMSDHGGLWGGFLYEMGHVFANEKAFFFILTYVALFFGAIVGPGMALSLYGGALDEGEEVKPWFTPVLAINAAIKGRYHWDNSSFAQSGFATALSNRLYFDHYYDMAMLKIVAAFSFKSAEADSKVIDGTIKTIERTSQQLSTKLRALTTGSARDYILMAAVGTLTLFALIWGVIA